MSRLKATSPPRTFLAALFLIVFSCHTRYYYVSAFSPSATSIQHCYVPCAPLTKARPSRCAGSSSNHRFLTGGLRQAHPDSPRLFHRHRRCVARSTSSTHLFGSVGGKGSSGAGATNDKNAAVKDEYFDLKTTVALIGGQSALVLVAVALSFIFRTPNYGFGPGISLDASVLAVGSLLALPLGLAAVGLDVIEDRFPALQDVTKATQRSVLSLLGGKFKPLLGLLVSTGLGIAAGVGEELIFRGVMQYTLAGAAWCPPALAVVISSVIFGVLHAVTPLYAVLAGVASLYFGSLYVVFDNLAYPIACHAVYDIAALFYAHWTVSKFSDKEKVELADWPGPTTGPL